MKDFASSIKILKKKFIYEKKKNNNIKINIIYFFIMIIRSDIN